MSDISKIKRNVARMVAAGAPESEIDEYISLEGVTVAQVKEAPVEQGFMQTLGDFASRANDELLLGWGAKYRAGMKAVLPEALGGTGKGYQENLELEKARQDRIDTERPALSVAARTAGLGAQMATGAGMANLVKAAPAATAGGRMLQASSVGAATGSAYGSGEAKSGDELMDGVIGMGLGAGAGLAGAGLVEGISSAIARRGMTDAQKASNRVAKSLMEDGVTPGAAAARIRDATEAGADGFSLIDAGGENVQRLGRAVKNLGGEAASKLDDFTHSRMAGQFDRTTAATEKAFGRHKSVDEVSDNLMQRAKDMTGPIYRNLDDVVSLSPAMKDKMARSAAVKEAFGKAEKIAAEFGDTLEPVFLNGGFNPKIEKVSAKTLHYLRMGMDDLIETQKTVLPNGTAKLSRLGSAMSETRRSIDGFLKSNSPGIRKADRIYSNFAKHNKALKSGTDFDRLEPKQLRSLIDKMTTKERAMYRLGAAWKLHKKLGSMNDNRDMAKAFLANPSERARINIILGGAGAKRVESLFGFREAEKAMARTHQRLSGNSTTAQQAEDMANLTGDKIAQTVRRGAWGSFKDWVADSISKTAGISEAEKKLIAEMLVETNEEGLDQAIELIAGEATRIASDSSMKAIGGLGGALATGEVTRDQILR